MIDHTSAVSMHAKTGNFMDIMVYGGKAVAQATTFESNESSL